MYGLFIILEINSSPFKKDATESATINPSSCGSAIWSTIYTIAKLNLVQSQPEVQNALFIVSTKWSCRSLVRFSSFFFYYDAIYLFHRPMVAKPISAIRSNGRASAQRIACSKKFFVILKKRRCRIGSDARNFA